MQTKSPQTRNVTFFVTVSLFALLLAWFGLGRTLFDHAWPLATFTWQMVVLALAVGLVLSGLALVVLTLRLDEARLQKIFFLLAGASAAAIPICVVLHNVVYGLCIWWFGQGFWDGHGTSEPVFLILAIIVFPALFVVGAAGSTVLTLKARIGPSSAR